MIARVGFLFSILTVTLFGAQDCTKDGWCKMEIGGPRKDYETLSSLFVRSPQDIWAFGRDYLYRYDGKDWTWDKIDPNAEWSEPHIVAPMGDTFVRAYSISFYNKVLIQKYSLAARSWITLHEISTITNLFGNIWASSEKDIYVSPEGRETVHCDGSRCLSLTEKEKVNGKLIAGTGPDHVWVGGDWGVWRKESGKWTFLDLYDRKAHSFEVTVIWTDRPGHGFAAATRFAEGTGDNLFFYEIDGDKVTTYDLKTSQSINAIAGKSRFNLYASGGMSRGFVVHFDGKKWTEEDTGLGEKNPSSVNGEIDTSKWESLNDLAWDRETGKIWGASSQRLVWKQAPRNFQPSDW
jgi:hypothetical protein